MQIECCGLTKTFDGRIVLQDLDWKVQKSDFWCVRGPSGVGKTTLLRLLLELEKPDAGTVVKEPGLRISPVFQEDRLLKDRSAVRNCMIFTNASERQTREILRQLLDESEALDKPVGQLSGGMRRRVALARALLADSDVLCLDEPFAGLDVETREHAQSVLERYRNDRTVILVSHEFTPQSAKILDLI